MGLYLSVRPDVPLLRGHEEGVGAHRGVGSGGRAFVPLKQTKDVSHLFRSICAGFSSFFDGAGSWAVDVRGEGVSTPGRLSVFARSFHAVLSVIDLRAAVSQMARGVQTDGGLASTWLVSVSGWGSLASRETRQYRRALCLTPTRTHVHTSLVRVSRTTAYAPLLRRLLAPRSTLLVAPSVAARTPGGQVLRISALVSAR